MKKRMAILLATISMAVLVVSGCANKETVKTEEPAPATTAKTEIFKPAQQSNPVQQSNSKTERSTIPAQQQIAEAPSHTGMSNVNSQAAASTINAFETVYFDFDKSDLRQDARNVLAQNADILLKSRTADKIRIEGHCDERGSAEYNLALGERRAKSALQYLITLGVKPERLSIISYGKEKPAVQGNDEEAWAKNRRAEFVLDK